MPSSTGSAIGPQILVISHMFPNSKTPISGIWVKEQVLALSKHCPVVVISPTPYTPHISSLRWYNRSSIPDKEIIGKVRVYHPRFLAIPFGIFSLFTDFSYFLAIVLLLFLKEKNTLKTFNILHAHAVVPDGIAAAILGRFLAKPVMITVHGSDLRHQFNKLAKGAVIRFALKRAELVISPHPELSVILKQIHCKSVDVYNGVDPQKFNSAITEDVKAIQKSLSIQNKKVVLFVSSLTDFKDPITMVEAIPLIVSKNKDIVFLMAGDGDLANCVSHLSSLLGVEEHLHLLGVRRDVNIILKLADVFLALSPYENLWSSALSEAMMSGKPCIVTKSGSAKKLSNSLSKVFYWIPPKDPQELARAVLAILENPQMASVLSSNALRFARDAFNIEINAVKIFDIYKKILQGGSTLT